MSLDKAINSGKEYREQYRGSKSFDHTCRNHGSCSWCESNRRFHDRKNRIRTDDELDETLEPLIDPNLDLDINTIFEQ